MRLIKIFIPFFALIFTGCITIELNSLTPTKLPLGDSIEIKATVTEGFKAGAEYSVDIYIDNKKYGSTIQFASGEITTSTIIKSIQLKENLTIGTHYLKLRYPDSFLERTIDEDTNQIAFKITGVSVYYPVNNNTQMPVTGKYVSTQNELASNMNGSLKDISIIDNEKYGKCAKFDNNNSSILINNYGMPDFVDTPIHSISFYFCPSDIIKKQILYEGGNSSSGMNLIIENGELSFINWYKNSAGILIYDKSKIKNISKDIWQQAGIVVDCSSGTKYLKVYVDNLLYLKKQITVIPSFNLEPAFGGINGTSLDGNKNIIYENGGLSFLGKMDEIYMVYYNPFTGGEPDVSIDYVFDCKNGDYNQDYDFTLSKDGLFGKVLISDIFATRINQLEYRTVINGIAGAWLVLNPAERTFSDINLKLESGKVYQYECRVLYDSIKYSPSIKSDGIRYIDLTQGIKCYKNSSSIDEIFEKTWSNTENNITDGMIYITSPVLFGADMYEYSFVKKGDSRIYTKTIYNNNTYPIPKNPDGTYGGQYEFVIRGIITENGVTTTTPELSFDVWIDDDAPQWNSGTKINDLRSLLDNFGDADRDYTNGGVNKDRLKFEATSNAIDKLSGVTKYFYTVTNNLNIDISKLGYIEIGSEPKGELQINGLVEGQKYYQILKCEDLAGNKSSVLISNGIIYDITPPTITLKMQDIDIDVFRGEESNMVFYTDGINLKLDLDFYDLLSGIDNKVNISNTDNLGNNKDFSLNNFQKSGNNFLGTIMYPMSDIPFLTIGGNKKIRIKIEDLAGNVSINDFGNVYFDNIAPAFGNAVLTSKLAYLSKSGNFLPLQNGTSAVQWKMQDYLDENPAKNIIDVRFGFNGIETGSGIYKLLFNGAQYLEPFGFKNGLSTFLLTNAATSYNQINVEVVDRAGNKSNITTFDFIKLEERGIVINTSVDIYGNKKKSTSIQIQNSNEFVNKSLD